MNWPESVFGIVCVVLLVESIFHPIAVIIGAIRGDVAINTKEDDD